MTIYRLNARLFNRFRTPSAARRCEESSTPYVESEHPSRGYRHQPPRDLRRYHANVRRPLRSASPPSAHAAVDAHHANAVGHEALPAPGVARTASPRSADHEVPERGVIYEVFDHEVYDHAAATAALDRGAIYDPWTRRETPLAADYDVDQSRVFLQTVLAASAAAVLVDTDGREAPADVLDATDAPIDPEVVEQLRARGARLGREAPATNSRASSAPTQSSGLSITSDDLAQTRERFAHLASPPAPDTLPDLEVSERLRQEVNAGVAGVLRPEDISSAFADEAAGPWQMSQTAIRHVENIQTAFQNLHGQPSAKSAPRPPDRRARSPTDEEVVRNFRQSIAWAGRVGLISDEEANEALAEAGLPASSAIAADAARTVFSLYNRPGRVSESDPLFASIQQDVLGRNPPRDAASATATEASRQYLAQDMSGFGGRNPARERSPNIMPRDTPPPPVRGGAAGSRPSPPAISSRRR